MGREEGEMRKGKRERKEGEVPALPIKIVSAPWV